MTSRTIWRTGAVLALGLAAAVAVPRVSRWWTAPASWLLSDLPATRARRFARQASGARGSSDRGLLPRLCTQLRTANGQSGHHPQRHGSRHEEASRYGRSALRGGQRCVALHARGRTAAAGGRSCAGSLGPLLTQRPRLSVARIRRRVPGSTRRYAAQPARVEATSRRE